jgi:hypothetical protein
MEETNGSVVSKWESIFKIFSESGLNRKEFCVQENLSYSAFSSFVTRQNKKKKGFLDSRVTSTPKARLGRKESTRNFIELDLGSGQDRSLPGIQQNPQPELIIELPLGVTLKFRGLQ